MHPADFLEKYSIYEKRTGSHLGRTEKINLRLSTLDLI